MKKEDKKYLQEDICECGHCYANHNIEESYCWINGCNCKGFKLKKEDWTDEEIEFYHRTGDVPYKEMKKVNKMDKLRLRDTTLSDTIYEDRWIHKKHIKDFVEIITKASDENDFDIMVEDGGTGNITISFSEFIKNRAGDLK